MHPGHWLVDYAHLIRAAWTMFCNKVPPIDYLGYELPGKVPVIIIPGIGGKWGFLKNLSDIISEQGHPVYVVHELGNNLKSISDSAKIVREMIKKNNIRNGVILAHSKGGLIGKYLLLHENPDERIIKMIAISTPFSGSALAKIVPHKAFHELLGSSPVITELKKDLSINHKIISIYAKHDNHVWHKDKCYIDNAENIELDDKGHHKIIFNKELQKIILSKINGLSK